MPCDSTLALTETALTPLASSRCSAEAWESFAAKPLMIGSSPVTLPPSARIAAFAAAAERPASIWTMTSTGDELAPSPAGTAPVAASARHSTAQRILPGATGLFMTGWPPCRANTRYELAAGPSRIRTRPLALRPRLATGLPWTCSFVTGGIGRPGGRMRVPGPTYESGSRCDVRRGRRGLGAREEEALAERRLE